MFKSIKNKTCTSLCESGEKTTSQPITSKTMKHKPVNSKDISTGPSKRSMQVYQ